MKQLFSIAIFLILGFAGFCQKAVDLGLSVKWATCNVGANTPEEYGEYYTFDEAQELSSSKWRVPTIEEINELLENCDYKWTTNNGVNGGLFTSKKNGNSIFFPAVGGRNGSDVYYMGSCGEYWSLSAKGNDEAYLFYFGDGKVFVSFGDRSIGRSVRLVKDVKRKKR
ncbi:MAG: hypothetical protein J6V74_04055 [Bacteroidales bacterium]|nr:hypothetical protein [Bacteroidales bacterium]